MPRLNLNLPSSIRERLPHPSRAALRWILYGVLLGFGLSIASTSLALHLHERRRKRIERQFEPRPIELRSDEIVDGVSGLIGTYFTARLLLAYEIVYSIIVL